ncbi:hypothetical protein [Stenotrophomonas rhizophila]|uniref:hypothetical protein n=1 Tax=Stenotrophomonas rhizophila TaxID=216778 RepID=UPI001E303D98|nr:hypothetical protein [Stenotrophomonas rhizophila]MCC7634349.1 hypothetical protein [Stenotrophomonas rhizophila]MCC7664043.1 hypothetical protein [Stenotrophomonas rhizophila]
MTAATAPVSSTAAGALSAFLRGVERRALVVAELQCGDPTVAEQALVAVMRAFAGIASDVPMAQWPDRFWILLAHRNPIRSPAAGGQWPPELAHLPALAPPARLALLLRIGGGLDEAAAAQILDLPVADYQQALAEACPRDAHGQPDAGRWRALAEQVQQRLRELPLARLQRLQQPVAATAAAPDAASWRTPARTAATSARPRRRGRGLPWKGMLIVLATAGVLLGGAAWWKHARDGAGPAASVPEGAVGDAGPVQVERLPAEDLPVTAPADPAHAASDAAMLADPELGLARDADLYAWFAAGGPVPVDESQPQPSRPEPAAAGLETTADE